MQHSTKRLAIAMFGGIILLLSILACGSTSSNTGTAVTSSSSPNSNTTPTSTSQHFKIGQTVKIGDTWQVTINSVKADQGSQYFKPKSGMAWLAFSITTKNISSQEQNISSELSFHLQDT